MLVGFATTLTHDTCSIVSPLGADDIPEGYRSFWVNNGVTDGKIAANSINNSLYDLYVRQLVPWLL